MTMLAAAVYVIILVFVWTVQLGLETQIMPVIGHFAD